MPALYLRKWPSCYRLVKKKPPNSNKPPNSLSALQRKSRSSFFCIRINDKAEYGLGFLHTKEQGLEVISHGGNTLGFTSDLFFLPERDLGVVVLTNLRVANAFLGTLRQRVFEVAFGAEQKSEEMVAATCKARRDEAAGRRDRIKTDSGSVAWIDEFVGEYRSRELGPARIMGNGGQFCVEFESWGSTLGVEVQQNGARLIALTGPPWSGSLRFQTSVETGNLILDAGQDKYTFQKQRRAAHFFGRESGGTSPFAR